MEENLIFGVLLFDYDELSDDDVVCGDSTVFHHQDPGGEEYLLSGPDSGSGRCYVNVWIENFGDPVLIELPKPPE